MAKAANLKIKATMDNSGLKDGVRGAKAAIRDFEKTGSDALSKLGDSFGVNTGKVEQMSSAIKGLGVKLTESSNAGSQALGKLLVGANGLAAGLAGIGIAGVVAGFKLLNEEATAFKNTVQGAHIDMMTTAYIDTYRQVLHDFNSETGKSVAEAEASWKKAWAGFAANLKTTILSAGRNILDGTRGAVPLAITTTSIASSAANQAASEAEAIAKNIFDVQRRISDQSVEWARLEREIAEQKRIAYDKTVDTATQQAALVRAAELINQRFGEEAELRKQLADLQSRYNDLASSSIADIDKANQLRIQEEATLARLNNALRELSERQASVAAQAQKEAQAREQALAAAKALEASRASLADWGSLPQPDMAALLPIGASQMELPGLAVKVTPELDTDAVVDISSELESLLTSSMENVGMTIGNLIGDLATGGDAWGNFANTAISAFGDMAISVGKMAVSTGTATLGIKAALESLNGWVAIAAGTALIALGAAVKQGLSNVATGNHSASANVASAGSYGSSQNLNTGFDIRQMDIKVTGKLVGSGSSLVAIIENENIRKEHTT